MKQKVSLGDLSSITTLEKGNLAGRMCNRNGKFFAKTTLSDVALMKSGYNLFSCTKMQKKGWALHGDCHAIWLTKGDDEIQFDIKITTPEGMVFAVYPKRDWICWYWNEEP